jgi:hypothetical protein
MHGETIYPRTPKKNWMARVRSMTREDLGDRVCCLLLTVAAIAAYALAYSYLTVGFTFL